MRPESDIEPHVIAVSVSNGGVPKHPLAVGTATEAGIEGDGHAHAKHNRADRAISILDIEIMRDLVEEGFPLQPGTAGENLTVEGLHVQKMQPGTLLEIGNVTLRLEEPRKPCFVLDVIHPVLKDAIVGRCGYMASVVRGGTIRPGMTIIVRDCLASIPCVDAYLGARDRTTHGDNLPQLLVTS
jgi:MOSC domain-containing protein YiiM